MIVLAGFLKAFCLYECILYSVVIDVISPVHGLYKIDYIKPFVATVSRRFVTSPMNVTRFLKPPHVKA